MTEGLYSANEYFDKAAGLLDHVRRSQQPTLRQAATAIAQAIGEDGVVYVFGSGHSHMLAEEVFYRAGGLAPIAPMLDSGLMLHESAAGGSELERLTGYARLLANKYDLAPPGVIVIASNSARNCVPVELALEAKARGVKVIAITSLAYANTSTPRPPATQKLTDVADWVLDNGAPAGDAAVMLEGMEQPIGALSTVGGALILNALMVQACAELLRQGKQPEVFLSGNLDGADAHNRRTMARWRKRIRHL